MQRSRGLALVVAGLLLFSATMVGSAVTAPDRNIGVDDGSTPSDSLPTADGESTASGESTVGDRTTGESTADGQSATGSTADGQMDDGTTTASQSATPTVERILLGIQGGGEGWREHGEVALLSNVRSTDRETQWRVSDADSYFDVTRMADGRVVTGFHHNGYEEECGAYESPCTKTGVRIIDPTGPGEPTVQTVYSFPVRSAFSSEVHDVEPLGDGQFLFTDMEYERIAITDGEGIVWQWNASSFYDAPDDPTRVDWLHINDVDVIGEGRYLVSVRNANQVLVIQRGEGVVEVINEDRGGNDGACTEHAGIADHDGDGDVRCGNPAVIDEQHNPQYLNDNAVLIADSGNDRVVELHRNDSGAWEPFWTLYEAGGDEFDWPRDADRLPSGNTLITDTFNKRVLEVEPDGDVVWSHATELFPYEADSYPAGEYPGRTFGAVTPTPSESTTTTASSDTGTTAGSDTTETGDTDSTDDIAGDTTASDDPATTASNGLATIAADDAGEVEERDTTVPGLSLLLVGMKSIAPWLPVWYTEAQAGVTLLSLGLVVGGGVGWYRRD